MFRKSNHIIFSFGSAIQKLQTKYLIALTLILSIPAFFYNLELNGFIGDEGIRTLVALEMKWSGDFIKPTLNGEEYFNKPPLYNWLIYFISELFGYYGEIPSRSLSLLFLSTFAISVYFISKKYTSHSIAILMPIMVLTSGRILFWDSMYGLIDICFSWIIYLNFMTLYTYGKRQQWNYFFSFSYFLCAIAFMLKGLPAIVFQFLSMITALVFFKVLKKKYFSVQHFLWAIAGFIPVICYYFIYSQQVSLEEVFNVLLEQSMSRTGSHHGLVKTIVHAVIFPFEQIYHFLPWSLLLLFIINKKTWTIIKSNQFILFNFYVLLVNVPVYWFSVEVYPRYLLMFMPLFNVVCIYLVSNLFPSDDPRHKNIQLALFCLLLILAGLFFTLPLFPQLVNIENLIPLALSSFLIMGLLAFSVKMDSRRYLLWFCCALLCVRIVFNMVIIPVRISQDKSNYCRDDSHRATMDKKEMPWYVYGKTEMHMVSKFYTSRDLNAIINRTNLAEDSTAVYIVDQDIYPYFKGIRIDSLYVETGRYLNLMKLN